MNCIEDDDSRLKPLKHDCFIKQMKGMGRFGGCLGVMVCLLSSPRALPQETKILQDFETNEDLNVFEIKNKTAVLSDQHVTHGQHGIRIAANEYLNTFRLPRDWSGFDALELDVFVEGDAPISGSLLIADAIWDQSDRSYWNRHNGSFNLRPGANTLSIPVNGLYRGEAGSRNNDIKSNIDPKQITRLDIGFSSDAKAPIALYLDHLRLSKESRPAGILAFDLGPASQTVAPGFTAISPDTVYGNTGHKAGLNAATGASQARDDTFPTRLYRDFIGMDGSTFIVEVPEASAKYYGWVMYDDLGYWGGEAAPYRQRSILADNIVVFKEDRGAGGPTDYLYKFEKIEPLPEDKLWDLYMAHLFKPRRFTCMSEGGRISLKFSADAGISCKVAAIVLYPDAIKASAEPWIDQLETRNRAEFEARAVFLGPKNLKLEIPAEAQARGYWLGGPRLDQDISLTDAPGPPIPAELKRSAARGQRISFTFAVRPLKDFPEPVQLGVPDLKSADAAISSREIDARYVHHATHRNFNDIAYSISPDTLRPLAGSELKLARDLTRQFWITLHIPDNAKAGIYTAPVTLTAGDLKITVPLAVEVLPFSLDEPKFTMGFFGTNIPQAILEQRGDEAWRDLFTTLKQSGMNSFSGGPNVEFGGFDAKGIPILDFSAVDRFMQLCQEAGFDKELNGYGGPGLITNLHESHAVGETGHAWEKKLGLPFGEILKRVWTAVRDHAAAHQWLPVAISMIDEPRVLEQAKENLELLQLYRQHAPWVNVGGSYSVEWNKTDPFDLVVQDIFKVAKWSSLNLHTQVDLDKARATGSEIQIYNQATTRYSFGAYQWAEMNKGVTSRMQWHLLALHGYQFFDLDGREPDTAMIHWTSQGIVPHIDLHRCREGADDFRFAQTLYNLAQKQKTNPAAQEALDWLSQIIRQIPINARERPAGFMDDETFREGCIERMRKLLSSG